MVHRPDGLNDRHVWVEELNSWLAPDVVDLLESGAPVTVEKDGVGYLLHKDAIIRYDLEPASKTRH